MSQSTLLHDAKPLSNLDLPDHRLPALVGLGTAVPEIRTSQHEMAAQLAAHWKLRSRDLTRWMSICDRSGIEFRHGVVTIDEALFLSTAQRMSYYEKFAPALAHRAATQALKQAAIPAERITDLIVVSCTGFSAPGLDVALCDSLGLAHNIRRHAVSFMGCFGAITGLRSAVGACSADPHAASLVICAELCTLHARDDAGIDNQIASALFADGAAAAVVLGSKTTELQDGMWNSLGHLTMGCSSLLPQGRDWMTWRVTDAGFAMTLSRNVPIALQKHIRAFVDSASDVAPASYAVHPGGPGILDAVDAGLQLNGLHGLESARTVLRDFGNMSSATVLFVLQEAFRHCVKRPVMALAFGPGLTIESITLM